MSPFKHGVDWPATIVLALLSLGGLCLFIWLASFIPNQAIGP